MLDLRHENKIEYNKKIKAMAESLSFKVSCSSEQGRLQGGAEGAVCLRASRSRGPHQLILKFLFIASLNVFKEPPNRSSLQGSKSAVLPLGLDNLSAALLHRDYGI